MSERVKNYLDSLFKDINETRKVRELKEELTYNLNDKISDLMLNGLTEDEAFKEAISSLGDTSELFNGLDTEVEITKDVVSVKKEESSFNRNLRALGYTVATALVLLAVLVMVIMGSLLESGFFDEIVKQAGAGGDIIRPIFNSGLMIIVPFLVILIPAVAIYVYLGATSKKTSPQIQNYEREYNYEKGDNVVENYNRVPKNKKREAVKSSLDLLAIALFLYLGLVHGAWVWCWVVFIVAKAAFSLIDAFLFE